MTDYEGTLDRATILAGWIEGTRKGLTLYSERRDLALDPLPDPLSAVMEFDHVIYSWGDGRHVQEVNGLWAPDAHQWEDEHGSWTTDFDGGQNGWRLMAGYSGQYAYAGPWMHQSEYIGGRMARDILATPGFFVAIYPSVTVYHDEGTDSADSDYSEEADTWAVAYISENVPGSIEL